MCSMDHRQRFSYIVVGSGSSGSVLASRLSEDASGTVLLLEAGQDHRTDSRVPAMSKVNPMDLWADPQWTDPHATAQRTIAQKQRQYPLAHCLGGGSAINGMGAIRPAPQDFARWRDQFGVEGWDWEATILPALKRLEDDPMGHGLDPSVHGIGGPIPIYRNPLKSWGRVASAMRSAALSLGYSESPDLNHPESTGVCPFPYNASPDKDGTLSRVAVNDCYLDCIRDSRSNLSIRCNAKVDRIMFQGGRVAGVVLHVSEEVVLVEKEVILCAGAVNTPAILQRSGIGPSALLQDLGIAIVVDLPGVGENLQDHPVINGRLPLAEAQDVNARHANALCRFSSTPGNPDLFNDLYFVSVEHGNDPRAMRLNSDGNSHAVPYGFIDVMLLKVNSMGNVHIRGTNPENPPIVRENMLSDEDDLERMIVGVRALAEMLQCADVKNIADPNYNIVLGQPEDPRTPKQMLEMIDQPSRRELYEWLQRNASDGIHISGGCAIGNIEDHMAVADAQCRVKGICGLRICDASIMPALVRCNTHLTCIALGEVAASIIKQHAIYCKLDLLVDCDRSVADTLSAWINTEWPSEVTAYGENPWTADRMWRLNCNRSSLPLTIVARDEKANVIGTVSLVNEDMVGRDEELGPWVAACYVPEQNRSRGIGHELVTRAGELARRIGLKQLHLWFPESKAHLRHFYEICGWQFLETTAYAESSFGEKVTIMRLPTLTDQILV